MVGDREETEEEEEDICILPADVGSCGGNETVNLRRYYYDKSRGVCLAFAYSGCGGNLNNFQSSQSCLDYCKRDSKL